TVTNTFIEEISGTLDKTNDADEDGLFGEPEEALEEGQAVEFQLIITNTSAIPVTITAITDTFGGQTINITECLDATDTNVIGTVLAASGDPGDSVTCTFTLANYAPPANTALDNTARVTLASEFDEVTPSDDSRVTTPQIFGGITPRPPAAPKTTPRILAFTGASLLLLLGAALTLISGGLLMRRSGRRKTYGF
ncbi:MAG TPA: hypothetical protein VE754_03165, partial [Actinomycetota bacterium]|nr:hypothetical protein [Actinomycetota bacterium]